MNRQMWDSFLQQIDAQVEGDFLSLAAQYERLMGRPFSVGDSPQVMFSMLQQAMMSQNKQLLRATVEFIAQLPLRLQAEFSVYSRHHHPDSSVSSRKKHRHRSHRKVPMASKIWEMLHLNRAV